MLRAALLLLCCLWTAHVHAQPVPERVVDLPTRPGITVRLLTLLPPAPRAGVVLLAGGDGGLQISDDGVPRTLARNFLVRTRQQFATRGIAVVVMDVPSDRQDGPHLDGFRTRDEHAADLKAVLAWLRGATGAGVPAWLVGTSRGTVSAAHGGIALAGDGGPDGVVLTSTILSDRRGTPVPAMRLGRIRVPVLVVHHEQDGCWACDFGRVAGLMRQLDGAPRTQLLSFTGGVTMGDPCGALAHHGYNGIEDEVVGRIVDWIVAR